MRDPWIVIARTHDGHPFGSVKVDGPEQARKTADRLIENPKIGSVRASRLREVERGNGRFR